MTHELPEIAAPNETARPNGDRLGRRQMLGLTAAAMGALLLPGCGSDGDSAGGTTATDGGGDAGPADAAGTIKIGYVTPRTGQLAEFGAADAFVLEQMRAHFAGGLEIDGETFAVEIYDRDSESNTTVAALVTQELILEDGVDLMLVNSTPETTVPVVQQCTNSEIPVLSNNAPWQPHYLSIGGDLAAAEPPVASPYNYHFFWGAEDLISVYIAMWDQVAPGAVVGAMWPDDVDGNAFSDPNAGFPPVIEGAGYTLVDPGRFDLASQDFSSQINAFKDAGVEILVGVLPPPVFGNFWAQCQQQGFTPKVVSMAKATEFPGAIDSFDNPEGLCVEMWWSDRHPTASTVTGQSSAELAAAWEEATGTQWSMSLGYGHSLFEVAIDAITRAGGSADRQALLDAMGETVLDTVVGTVDFTNSVVPHVTKTPLIGGQWVAGDGDWPYELAIRTTEQLPSLEVDGPMVAIEL